jgi:hypothetical protein
VGGLDPVPAVVLGRVQGPVGGAEKAVGVAGMVGQDRDADADGDPLLDAGDRDRGDRGAEPLGELDRPGQAGVGEQDEELLTAPTAARTSSPRACPDTSLTC